jgi:hypothetical protein
LMAPGLTCFTLPLSTLRALIFTLHLPLFN